jgi:hypothetical protein
MRDNLKKQRTETNRRRFDVVEEDSFSSSFSERFFDFLLIGARERRKSGRSTHQNPGVNLLYPAAIILN